MREVTVKQDPAAVPGFLCPHCGSDDAESWTAEGERAESEVEADTWRCDDCGAFGDIQAWVPDEVVLTVDIRAARLNRPPTPSGECTFCGSYAPPLVDSETHRVECSDCGAYLRA